MEMQIRLQITTIEKQGVKIQINLFLTGISFNLDIILIFNSNYYFDQ